MRAIRLFALYLARFAGLFALARRLTAGDLRILCYHGASLVDEHEYRPGLFITDATFRQRLRLLVDKQYPVLSLEDALQRLKAGNLPDGATVITIDDGWYGTFSIMGPALREARLPATLYLATYYVEKGTQVFNVAAGYILWRAGSQVLDLSKVQSGLQGVFDLASAAAREKAVEALEAWGNPREAGDRQRLLQALCVVVGVDWAQIESRRQLTFMAPAEAQSLAADGVGLQLHTHRHGFPLEHRLAEVEIADNRRALARISAKPAVHFCYPSGEYSREQLPWLEDMGIRSAVTTDRGLARRSSGRFTLPRLLDSETVTLLEFESEVSGFRELLRRIGQFTTSGSS